MKAQELFIAFTKTDRFPKVVDFLAEAVPRSFLVVCDITAKIGETVAQNFDPHYENRIDKRTEEHDTYIFPLPMTNFQRLRDAVGYEDQFSFESVEGAVHMFVVTDEESGTFSLAPMKEIERARDRMENERENGLWN